ncbi:MAG: flagellar hook-length control protein FliK [Candidatus Kapaibacterium sp.]
MKIDIHILTNSVGLISDTAGVKSPEGEYSPPVIAFSNLLQSTIDNNTPQNKNLNTKNSTSIENSIGAIQVEESLSSLRIATEPTSSTVQQTENVFETALQNSNTIGVERKEYSVNDGQKNVKLSQRINNIQDKDVVTQHHLTYSTIENNSTNAIDEFRYHNVEHIIYPLQTKENVVQKKISAQDTAKEKFIEIESMIRDFSDSMKVQTKGKVHINILPSHIDDVQVRVDISHAANDEIPQIMEMIIQNLWIPMQQKNQQSGINNIEDSLTVQYEHTSSEKNFEQILHSESENTSYDTIQLKNQTQQYHNTLNLNTKGHSVSSEHKIYSQVATDFDADSALESSHRSKQDSVIHEYKQENSDYSVELHSDIAEKQIPVLTQNQETLRDNIFDETENAHQTSYKTTNNSQNDEIALFNQSGFNKKPSKQLESNFPHESVQGKSTPSEKLEYINSSNRKLSTSPLSVNSDLQNNALQSYITTLFPEPSNNVENMTDNEDRQILKNNESSHIANMSFSSGNHSVSLENSDKPFLVNNAVQERKKTVVNEYILNANEKNSPSLDVKNNNKEQLQKYEPYREQGEVAEIYVHNDNVNINSTKELNTINTEILYHELQDSRKKSSDVNESDIVQSETEGGDIQNEILERKLPKTINSSQDNIERNTINIESETLDGNLFELNNSIVSHGKNHPTYSKDSSSLNHRNDNVVNRTSVQDLEQGTIEKNGLYDVKNYGGKVHDNASNDKTINENNKQEHLPTIKQSALNVTISENEDDYNNAETNVPLHLNNSPDNEILGIHTKKIVTNKSVHSNSGEVEKLHSIVDIKNIDSDNITKDNVGLDETSIFPKKISPNTTLNDESLNKSAEHSVNVDNYTIKEKNLTLGNTNIGLANKIQDRVSEEVILSTELEENSVIQGEKQRTTVNNGVEQRDNPVIRKNSNLNFIQYQKSVDDSDDVSVNINVEETKSIEQKPETSTSRTSKSDQDLQSEKLDFVNESKEIEKSHSEQQKTTLKSAVDQSNNPVMIKRSSVNPIENTLSVEADDNSSNVVPNQSKINRQNSEKSISHISQNDQDFQLVKVDFINESKEIEKAHSEQQKTTLNDATDQSDNRVMMQSQNMHPNKNEKIVNNTQDASTNIQEGEVVKSVNTTLHKPDSFPENSQVLQDSDIIRINDETIENRTSHSQLIRSRSVKEVSNIDSTTHSQPLFESAYVHKEDELKSNVEHPTIHYSKSGKILESENQAEFLSKNEINPTKPQSGTINTITDDIITDDVKIAIDKDVSAIHIEKSVEKNDETEQIYTFTSLREKQSVNTDRLVSLNADKNLHRTHDVPSQIQESKLVKNQSDNISIFDNKDKTKQSISQYDDLISTPIKSKNDSKIDNNRIAEIDPQITVFDDEQIELTENNLQLHSDSDKINPLIAVKKIIANSVELTKEQNQIVNKSIKTLTLDMGLNDAVLSESPQGIVVHEGVAEVGTASKQVSSRSNLSTLTVDEQQENTSELLYGVFHDENNKDVNTKRLPTEIQKPEKLVSDNDVNIQSSSLKSASHEKMMANQNTENTHYRALTSIHNTVSETVETVQSTKKIQETLQDNTKKNIDSNDSTHTGVTTEDNILNQQSLHTPKTTSLKNKSAPTINRVHSENIQTKISDKVSLSVEHNNNLFDETRISSKYNKINAEIIHSKADNNSHSVTSTLFKNDVESEIVKDTDTSENTETDEYSVSHSIPETKNDTPLNVLNAERSLHPPLQTSDGTVYVLKNKNPDNAAIVITPPSELQTLGQTVPNTAIALHSIIEKASSVGVPVKNIVFKIRYNDAITSESAGVLSNTNNKIDATQSVHIPQNNIHNDDGIVYQTKAMLSAKSFDNQEIMGIMKQGIASNNMNGEVEKKSDKKFAISGNQNYDTLMPEGSIKKSENTSQQHSSKHDNNLLKKDSFSYRTSLKNSLSNNNVEKSIRFSDIMPSAVAELGNTVQTETSRIIRSNNDVPINGSAYSSKQDSPEAETELQTSLSQNSGQSLGLPDSLSHSVMSENGNSSSRGGIIMPQNLNIQAPINNGVTTMRKGTSMETTESFPVHHFAEKAHEYISAKPQGDGTVRMVLQPEELGQVIVRYSTHSSDAQLHIQVDSQQTKQIIESQLPQLKDQFGKQGMQLDNVEVSVRKKEEEMSNNSQYSHNRQGQSQQEQESRQQFTRSFKYAADARKAQMTVNYNSSAFNRIFQSQR